MNHGELIIGDTQRSVTAMTIPLTETGHLIIPEDPKGLVQFVDADGEVQSQDHLVDEEGNKLNRCFALAFDMRTRILEATSMDEVDRRMAEEHPGTRYVRYAEPNFSGVTREQLEGDFGPVEGLVEPEGDDVAEAQ